MADTDKKEEATEEDTTKKAAGKDKGAAKAGTAAKKEKKETAKEKKGDGGAKAKKDAKDKKAKAPKKEKKAKAPKPHLSSKAGPGFTIKINDEKPPRVEIASINKKGHSFKLGLREGDVITTINSITLEDSMKLNDVKAMLIGNSGTEVRLKVDRKGEELKFAVMLEFAPLVKTIKSGKPMLRGKSAEISLKLVDSDQKRELFFLAGALQPLCKLLIDPKAAAQVQRGINALQNMMRMAMWEDIQVALSSVGKPLVQLIEKGGLAKKMMGIDLLVRISLFSPTHSVLIAGGVLESCCSAPKGIIPTILPKFTHKGWKPGRKVTGLETKAANLLGCLARMADTTRERINNGTNNGVMLLVRMMMRDKEPAGKLNEIGPDSAAVALESLQYLALNASCRSTLDAAGALETISELLVLDRAVAEQTVDVDAVRSELRQVDFKGDGNLNLKEFEQWYVGTKRGDGRQAKAAFREVDSDGTGNISYEEALEFVARKLPHQTVDMSAAWTVRNVAVTEHFRGRLLECGVVEGLVKLLAWEEDEERRLAGTLALLNLAFHRPCQRRMTELDVEGPLVAMLGPSELGCAAALVVRQMAILQASQQKMVDGGVVEKLLAMLQERRQLPATDPVGNPFSIDTETAAVAALQNVLAEHEGATRAAKEQGVVELIVEAVTRWAATQQAEPTEGFEWLEEEEEEEEGGPGGAASEEEGGGGTSGEEDGGEHAGMIDDVKLAFGTLAVDRGGDKEDEEGAAVALGGEGEPGARESREGREGGGEAAAASGEGTPKFQEEEGERMGPVMDEGSESEVTWTDWWWREQERLVACRAAWIVRTLAFRNREALLEMEVDHVMHRVVRIASDEETDAGATWALLSLDPSHKTHTSLD